MKSGVAVESHLYILRTVTMSLSPSNTHTEKHNKKPKHQAEAGKRVKGYRIGRREPSRLFKSIFLPTPNYLGVFRPFFGNFEVSLSNSSKSKSLDWMDPLMRQFFPFMGSETKKLIPTCTLRCPRQGWLPSVFRDTIQEGGIVQKCFTDKS